MTSIQILLMLAVTQAHGGCSAKLLEDADRRRGLYKLPPDKEIALVAQHVTQRHLDECKSKIESEKGTFGSSVRLMEALEPSLPHTCAAKFGKHVIFDFARVAAYVATAEFKGPTLVPSALRGCTMVLKDNELKVELGVPLRARYDSVCHRL